MIGTITGNNVAELVTLYTHANTGQIQALLGHEPDGATLNALIALVTGNNVVQLVALYATGITTVNLQALLPLEHNGATLLGLVNAIIVPTPADIQYLGDMLRDVANRASLLALLGAINGITFPRLMLRDLLRPLSYDGLTGPQILVLFQHWTAAGENAGQINARVTNLRGNLAHAAPPTNAETPITAAAGGQQKLSGQDIHTHVVGTVAAGRSALNSATHYPTGQAIAGQTVDQLWTDCSPAGVHVDVNTGAAETPQQVAVRQKQALNRLMTTNAARSVLIQNIFLHNNGQTPRPFVSAANDDGYVVGAHTTNKHVLGAGGVIDTHLDLAHRAGWKIPLPHPGSGATAYNNIGEANAQINGALAAVFHPNWVVNRRNLTTGVAVGGVNHPTAPVGIRYRKQPPGQQVAYPNPLTPILAVRPWIGPGPGGAPPLGLTYDDTASITNIRVIIRPSNILAAHGWAVYTSFPTL